MKPVSPPPAPPFERYTAALAALPADERSRPLGLLDLDAFRANAAALHARAGAVPVRVASKSVRIRRAITEALDQPGFAGIMAYSLTEALWWVESGRTDVLVAYPTTDEAALTAWQPLRRLRVGALRSAVRTPEQARALAERITRTPGLRLSGLLAYEGQVAGVPEGSGPRAAAIRLVKSRSIRDLSSRRPAIVAAVRAAARAAGADLDFVNGGGTGSVESTVAEGAVTEIGAGSGLMGPASFDGFRGLGLRPASFFTRPVVRRPAADVVTVAGGGWIASGVPGADRSPTVAWPAGLSYSSQEGAGEVQTPLRGRAAAGLRLGDPVFFRHAKAGEPAEHLHAVAVYSRGEDAIVDLWPTYRGEGRMFS